MSEALLKLLLKSIYGLKKMLVEEFKNGCLVHGHL